MLLEGKLTEKVIELAMEVHRQLGPGLLESAYEACLCYELGEAGVAFERQIGLPVVCKNVRLDAGFRADLLVDRSLILEIKSVAAVAAVHEAQILTYLRLSGCRVGLLMNFNALRLKDGLRRFVL